MAAGPAVRYPACATLSIDSGISTCGLKESYAKETWPSSTGLRVASSSTESTKGRHSRRQAKSFGRAPAGGVGGKGCTVFLVHFLNVIKQGELSHFSVASRMMRRL